MFNLLFDDCLNHHAGKNFDLVDRGDRLFGLSDHGGLAIDAKTTETFVLTRTHRTHKVRRTRTIGTRAFPLETHVRAYMCRENVIQDASPRIKERNRPVKYNFATGEGGATREGRLSFSR